MPIYRIASWAVAAQTAYYLVFLLAGGMLLDIDSDRGLFTYVSTAVTLAAAVALWTLRPRMLWLVIAVAFLAVDDVVGIHERINQHVGPFPAWPFFYGPLLALVFAGLWRFRAARPGLALLALAIGLELATAAVFALEPNGGSLYRLEVILEEGAELAGWIVIAGAFARERIGARTGEDMALAAAVMCAATPFVLYLAAGQPV